MGAQPRDVTVILPCYNEANTIETCLSSLLDDFTRTRCQILVVDGMSTDGTPEVVRDFQRRHGGIELLENQARLQACGLNLALAHATGTVIVRGDAHCVYPPGYVGRCVEMLTTSGAANVGGVMRPVGETTFQRAVSVAMRHWFGVGNSPFHLGNFTACVETVYLGTFRKALFDEVGVFDPDCHPAEDAELNLRIRRRGGRLLLDSSLQVDYVPRGSWARLARQYYGYSCGRAAMVAKHGLSSLRGRHWAPPVLVVALAASLLLAPLFPPCLALPLFYLAALVLVSLLTTLDRDLRVKGVLPLVFATMHLVWGAGFLYRLLAGQVLWRLMARPCSGRTHPIPQAEE